MSMLELARNGRETQTRLELMALQATAAGRTCDLGVPGSSLLHQLLDTQAQRQLLAPTLLRLARPLVFRAAQRAANCRLRYMSLAPKAPSPAGHQHERVSAALDAIDDSVIVHISTWLDDATLATAFFPACSRFARLFCIEPLSGADCNPGGFGVGALPTSASTGRASTESTSAAGASTTATATSFGSTAADSTTCG